MAVKLTKEFWINVVLFIVACVALGLSIWAFATPCKKDGFGDLKEGCPIVNFDGCSEYGKNEPLDNCTGTPVNLGNAGKFCCPNINFDGCSEHGKDEPLDNCTGTPVNLGNAGKFCCP